MHYRRFVPVYPDHWQALECTLTHYTLSASGELLAHFADGRAIASIHGSLQGLLRDANADWRERVREVPNPY